MLTEDEYLLAGWRIHNPNPLCLAHTQQLLPSGFWPEVAKIAMRLPPASATQADIEAEVANARRDWEERGQPYLPDGEPRRTAKIAARRDAKTRAENTARLLSLL